ncbi:MAG: DUF47 family protein [Streptosporangiales bacterium]|nr:DUF47 family protein [Streptosporangiales bacterium]
MRLASHDARFRDLYVRQAENISAGARVLLQVTGPTHEDPVALADRMRAIEQAGDALVRAIVRELAGTMIAPFEPVDIARLAARLNDVLDQMETAVDRIVRYELTDLPPGLAKQAELLFQAAEMTVEAMRAGGRGRAAHTDDAGLRAYWIAINSLENQGDEIYRQLLADLFAGGYDAISAMKYKDVVDHLEDALDAFERAANTVEAITIKELGGE